MTVLKALGVNTTRLQWRLFNWEKKRALKKEQGTRLPSRVHWLNYPHKFCWKCNALNSREDKRCHECGARLPSRALYLVMRSLGLFVPRTGTPVSFALIGICVVVYALTAAMSGGGLFSGPSPQVTAIFGSYFPAFTFYLTSHPEVAAIYKSWELAEPFGFPQWRILAFALVHGGLMHIGFNMFCLFQIGPMLESNLRPYRFLVLCTLTQIGAAAATYGWVSYTGNSIYYSTVGASGILFGLIGFGIAFFRTGGGAADQYRRSLIQWAIYAFVFGLIMGANNAAHAGGFVAGYLLGMLPVSGPAARSLERFWVGGAATSAVLWAITVITMIASVVVNVSG